MIMVHRYCRSSATSFTVCARLDTIAYVSNFTTVGHHGDDDVAPPLGWGELVKDYAAMSTSMAALAETQFHAIRMRDRDTVLPTQHQFSLVVNVCVIQAVATTEDDTTLVLLTHPTKRWRIFMDAYAI